MGFLGNNDGFQDVPAGAPDLEQNFDARFGAPQPNALQQILAQAGPLNTTPVNIDIPAPTVAPSGRRSVIDIIGGLGDVFANAGGATAQYQPALDARAARERQAIDQSWQDKFNVQKERVGEQTIAAGDQELTDKRRTLLGQAARGVTAVFNRGGTPEEKAAGVLKAWPMVARQLGLTNEQSAQFVSDFQQDPEGTLSAMNAALIPPSEQGSKPKEIQIYELLKAKDPVAAEKYLEQVSSGDKGITAYQAAQLGLGRERLDVSARSAAARDSVARERLRLAGEKAANGGKPKGDPVAAAQSAQTVINDMRDAFNRLKAAGGINAKGQSAGQRAGAWAMENIPLAERATNPDAFSARQDLDRLRTQGITSLLPMLGGLQLGGKNIDAAKELDTWRKAIASASDYESAMRALNGFQTRINQIVREANSPSARRPANAPAPRRPAASGNSGGWKVVGVK